MLVSELNFLETRVLELQSLIDQSRRDQYQHDIAQLAERNLASEIASPQCLNGLARKNTIRPNPKLPQRRMTSTKTEDDFNSEESNANSDSGVDDFETCIYSEILELSAVPKLDLDLDIDLKTPTKDAGNQPETSQVCTPLNLPKPVQKYSKGRLPIELHSPATLLVAKLKKDFDDFEILSPMATSSTTKFTYPKSLPSKSCQQPCEPETKLPTSETKEPPVSKSRLKSKLIQMFKTKKPNQLKRSASTFDLIRSYPLQFRF